MKLYDNCLVAATQTGDQFAVERLLQSGISPDCRDIFIGSTALHCAIEKQSFDLVKLLVENGANIDDDKNDSRSSPLGTAMMIGNEQIVRFLLDQGARLSCSEIDTEIVQEVRSLGLNQIADAVEVSQSL